MMYDVRGILHWLFSRIYFELWGDYFSEVYSKQFKAVVSEFSENYESLAAGSFLWALIGEFLELK
jgi:hypothetical protein